ncbi:MAG TPA: TonB family protein [Candidatus Acidoferrales bacterium]|jgi:TonB family protein|nr:TonB family protein [Candidatus Acidoferrales bacterium]
MAEPMHPLLQGEPHPLKGSIEELPPHSRLPRLDLAIDWESPQEEFASSVRDFFAGPRASKENDPPNDRALRVDWVEGKPPGKAFLASCLWHGIAVWLLILPIWGFLPQTQPTLAPVQIEYDVYDPPDLPKILLPNAAAKPSPPPKKAEDASNQPVARGEDAYHPRQTILSVPVHVTHPRQTLIQPDAPPDAPKIVAPLPNIVQWAEKDQPKLRIPVVPTAVAPKIEQRKVRAVAAPDVANNEKNSGPLNIAQSQVDIARPEIPINPMSKPVERQRTARENPAVAPEIAENQGDLNARRLIALSATPAPPAPEVSVPQGNLAARISVGPDAKPGAPGGAEHGATGTAEGKGAAAAGTGASAGEAGRGNVSAMAGGAGNSNGELPAAISISGGSPRAAGGGLAPAHHGLILQPMVAMDPAASVRRGPANVAGLNPSLPPEAIFGGKEIHTLRIDLPNLTSASGSWLLNFAQLDEDPRPPYRPKGTLSGPQPVTKVDPEYPEDTIKEHIDGEVVLYAIIRKDGTVDSIQLMRSLDPRLDKSAMAALARWKFLPGKRAGVPVDLEAVVHIPFEYKNPHDE